jgi:hypothetical protein
MASELVPVVTFALGAGSTFAAQIIRESRTSSREREARQAEREVARDIFQRETLLELQGATIELLRCTTKLHLHQRTSFAKTGTWDVSGQPDGLAEAGMSAAATVSRLRQRISDDELRADIRQLQELCVGAYGAKLGIPDYVAARGADGAFVALGPANEKLEDRIGVVMRALP